MREGNGMEGEREGGLEAVIYVDVVFFLRRLIFIALLTFCFYLFILLLLKEGIYCYYISLPIY